MANTKEEKVKLVSQYQAWFSQSQAAFITEYTGLNMKSMDELRAKVREAGGEFHIVKNTLTQLAIKDAGYSAPESLFKGSTAIGFAFSDTLGMAKVLTDFAQSSDTLKIKGGFLGNQTITASDVKALATLPPLPVIRAQLLGIILAPATKLARILVEPGRQIASVVKAFSEKENVPQTA